jgi:hypothetical protein
MSKTLDAAIAELHDDLQHAVMKFLQTDIDLSGDESAMAALLWNLTRSAAMVAIPGKISEEEFIGIARASFEHVQEEGLEEPLNSIVSAHPETGHQ